MIKSIREFMDSHEHTMDEIKSAFKDEYEYIDSISEATYKKRVKDFEIEYPDKSTDSDEFYEMKDEYFPIWNYFWEFPSHLSEEDLNCMNLPNLVFFKGKYKIYNNEEEISMYVENQFDDVDTAYELILSFLEVKFDNKKFDFPKECKGLGIYLANNEFDKEDLEEYFNEYFDFSELKDIFEEFIKYDESTTEIFNPENLDDEDRFYYEVEEGILVGLTACGMDLSPSLLTAYFLYSNEDFEITDILNTILSSGLDYFKYVCGNKVLEKLIEKIGKEKIDEYDEECKKRMKEFDERLKKITNAKKEGKIDDIIMKFGAIFAFLETKKEYKPEGDKNVE